MPDWNQFFVDEEIKCYKEFRSQNIAIDRLCNAKFALTVWDTYSLWHIVWCAFSWTFCDFCENFVDMAKNVLQSLLLQHSKSKIYLKMLTMLTCTYLNWLIVQWERAYYPNYFINTRGKRAVYFRLFCIVWSKRNLYEQGATKELYKFRIFYSSRRGPL